ncbi:MAG: hypothetical protein ABI807_02540 [Sporichthyaceae bacterium]
MTSPADEELITVVVGQIPIGLQTAAQQHTDEITRELVLVAEQVHQRGDPGGLPQRFVELVSALSARYSMFTAEQESQLARAVQEGRESVDLVYSVPASAAVAAAQLGSIFDEVDEYCREGRLLLTLESPAPVVAYRRWFLDQFVEQSQGRPPIAWPDHRDRVAPA